MKSNSIIFIVSIIILAAAGYWYFTSSSGNDLPLTASAPVGTEGQSQVQAFISQLQSLSFNTAIFSDPKFTALQDLTTPIAPEASGRLDPFAPIPGVTGQ
jgi:hypothetical protein